MIEPSEVNTILHERLNTTFKRVMDNNPCIVYSELHVKSIHGLISCNILMLGRELGIEVSSDFMSFKVEDVLGFNLVLNLPPIHHIFPELVEH